MLDCPEASRHSSQNQLAVRKFSHLRRILPSHKRAYFKTLIQNRRLHFMFSVVLLLYFFFSLCCITVLLHRTNSGSLLHGVRGLPRKDCGDHSVWTTASFNISWTLVNPSHLKCQAWHQLCTETGFFLWFLAWFTETRAGQATGSRVQHNCSQT